MSYMVLARKWRPRTFAEMTGQEHVTKTLTNALRTGRMAHAYLFHGPRGVGKTTAARILAKAINCTQELGTEPCNQCAVCTSINHGTSLDVVEMDGASNRGIDEIRELREHVGYAPVSAQYKVYIIDEVHMLTEQAFNALLKTLEEPPAHVVFIFATTEVHKVPATILSRCQRFEFRRIPHAAVVQRLAFLAEHEELPVDPPALALMARRAEGCLRDAESLLDQAGAAHDGIIDEALVRQLLGLSPVEELQALLEAMARNDLAATALQLDRMVSNGMEIDRIVIDLVDLLLELVRVRLGKEDPSLAAQTAPDLAPEDLLRCVAILQASLQAARHSARPGPVLESALFRLALLDRSIAIEDVLNALGRADAPQRESAQSPAVRSETARPAPAEDQGGGGDHERLLASAWRALSASTKSFVVRATSSWQDDTVILQFKPEHGFAAAALGQADRRVEMERALAAAFGRPMRVEIVETPRGAAASPARAPGEHRLVKDIVQRFDGIVIETRQPREEARER